MLSLVRDYREGALFTDDCAEQSCTAGRASFITGQLPFRGGLSKVGRPGAKQAISDDDPTEDPRFGVVGKQRIKSLGQLTIERMKTYDDETIEQSLDFMRGAVEADKPFSIRHNTTRTHSFAHLRPKYEAMIPEKGFMGAAMTEFDDGIGILLDELEKLEIAEDTVVIISSDNGAMQFA
jgi:arylsulfatase